MLHELNKLNEKLTSRLNQIEDRVPGLEDW